MTQCVPFQATKIFAATRTLQTVLDPFTAEDELTLCNDRIKAELANLDDAIEALTKPSAGEDIPETICELVPYPAAT